MPPVVIAGGIAAAGAIGGAALSASAQNKAANKAADVSLQTADKNNALTREIYGENKATLAPFVASGTAAGTTVNNALAGGPYGGAPLDSTFVNSALNPGSLTDFRSSIGYNDIIAEGLKGVNVNLGAKGAYQSGAAVKEAGRFTANLANSTYKDYINQLDRYASYADAWKQNERGYGTDQYNTWINALTGQQGIGLQAAGAQANVGVNFANTTSANNNQAAAAAANAALAKGAGTSSAIATGTNALGYLAGQFINPAQYNPYGIASTPPPAATAYANTGGYPMYGYS